MGNILVITLVSVLYGGAIGDNIYLGLKDDALHIRKQKSRTMSEEMVSVRVRMEKARVSRLRKRGFQSFFVRSLLDLYHMFGAFIHLETS